MKFSDMKKGDTSAWKNPEGNTFELRLVYLKNILQLYKPLLT